MRTQHVYIYAFRGEGDSDAETDANVESLRTRYRSRHPECLQHVVKFDKKGETHERTAEADSQEVASGEAGVYLVCHGGPTQCKPAPDVLADTVYNDLMAGGAVTVRKIHLMSCKGAGGSYAAAALSGSPLSQFCRLLSARALEPGARPLPDGLMVCAYNATVTTVEVGYKVTKGDWSAELTKSVELRKVRTALTGKLWQPTHPFPLGDESAELAETMRSVISEIEETIWKTKRDVFWNNDARTKGTPVPKGTFSELRSGNRAAADKFATSQKLANKVVTAINKKDASTQALWKSLKQYLQTKVVLKFLAETKTFQPCSLSEYTDNTELATIISAVESGLYEQQPTVKLTLNV